MLSKVICFQYPTKNISIRGQYSLVELIFGLNDGTLVNKKGFSYAELASEPRFSAGGVCKPQDPILRVPIVVDRLILPSQGKGDTPFRPN